MTVMRVLIFSFTGLVAIVIAAAIWWTGRDLDAERAKIEARRIESVSKIGIRRMLSENGNFKIFDVALGKRLDDGTRDFRGFLERDGNAFPAYGRVRSVCETAGEKPECWEIAYLEAKGKEIDTVGKLPVPEPGSEIQGENSEQTLPQSPNAASDQSAGLGEDTASLTTLPEPSPVTDPAPAAAAKEPELTAKPQPDPASVEAGPLPTHKVVPSRVNARQGPSLDQPVLTVLSKGTELAILDERNGWGDFLVMQGENEGTRAWIALSIVAEIEPQ
jgi:SH3 domain-containing protein